MKEHYAEKITESKIIADKQGYQKDLSNIDAVYQQEKDGKIEMGDQLPCTFGFSAVYKNVTKKLNIDSASIPTKEQLQRLPESKRNANPQDVLPHDLTSPHATAFALKLHSVMDPTMPQITEENRAEWQKKSLEEIMPKPGYIYVDLRHHVLPEKLHHERPIDKYPYCYALHVSTVTDVTLDKDGKGFTVEIFSNGTSLYKKPWGCSRLANMLGYYNEDKSLQDIEERPASAA